MSSESSSNFVLGGFALFLLILLGGGISGCMFVMPQYGVWHAKMNGEAEYAQAEQNRRIKTLEATAKMQSAEPRVSLRLIKLLAIP